MDVWMIQHFLMLLGTQMHVQIQYVHQNLLR